MTLEQATQKILDKALSLTEGWVETTSDAFNYGRKYEHPEMGGVYLNERIDGGPFSGTPMVHTAHLMMKSGVGIHSSEALLQHLRKVQNHIKDNAVRVFEESIIAIAQQINP